MSRWRKAGVALNPPAQPEALGALQGCVGVPVRSGIGIPFADVLIESWRIYLRPSECGVSVASAMPAFCFPSLDAFFERYMQEPGSLGLLE